MLRSLTPRAALVRRLRAAQLSTARAPAAPPRRLASSGPGTWISRLAPMARQAFSWDMSVDRERVWFSFQEEGAEKLLASFRTAADSDFGGQSQCTLELTEHGSAVFSGHLSLALAHRSAQGGENEEGKESATVKQRLANWFAGQRPRTAKGGFVAMASFPHALPPDIDDFNTLTFRVKADGRLYCVNLKTEALPLESVYQVLRKKNKKNSSALTFENVYQAVLVAKSPGEWEEIKVKASDFILTHKGLVNINKVRMNWRAIKTFGISLMDRQDGPFRLELQSVTLERLDDVDGTDAL